MESRHASDGSDQESYRPKTQALHEDMSRMRRKKRCKRGEVQKLPKQELALEEKRACEVIFSPKPKPSSTYLSTPSHARTHIESACEKRVRRIQDCNAREATQLWGWK